MKDQACKPIGSAPCCVRRCLRLTGDAGGAAEEIHIKMLDRSGSGPPAFEPGFVKGKPRRRAGQNPQKGGHSTVALLVPPRAGPESGVADRKPASPWDAEGLPLRAQLTR